MNSKMTTKSQLSPPEPKRNKQKNHQKKKNTPLSKQLEQEQNHRNGDHMEGYPWGGGWEEWGRKV